VILEGSGLRAFGLEGFLGFFLCLDCFLFTFLLGAFSPCAFNKTSLLLIKINMRVCVRCGSICAQCD
jgi:hypothetical protein